MAFVRQETIGRFRWCALAFVSLYVLSYIALTTAGRERRWPNEYVFRYSSNLTIHVAAYYFYYPCYMIDQRLRHVQAVTGD